MFMIPIIMLLFCGIFLFAFIGESVSNVSNGGQVVYDEATFQNYANTQYAAAFGDSSAYEDNLLLVFLTNEEADGYYTIAWIGDNVKSEISNMFGDETSKYGTAVLGNINSEYYAYSLDSNLAAVVDSMAAHIARLGLESSFRTQSDRSATPESRLINYTAHPISGQTVETSIDSFTEQTDIPLVIVVEDMEVVFGKTVSSTDWSGLIITLILAAVAIFLIVKAVKELGSKGKGGNNQSGNNSGGNDSNNGGGYYNSYEYK